MTRERPTDVLLARVRGLVPEAHSFLLTSTRASRWVLTVATEFAASLQAVEESVELASLMARDDRGGIDTSSGIDDSNQLPLPRRLTVGDPRGARVVIAETAGVVVLASDGILDRGMPVTLAGAVDVVILVVKRGESTRADIPLAACTIEEAGGRLLFVAYRV